MRIQLATPRWFLTGLGVLLAALLLLAQPATLVFAAFVTQGSNVQVTTSGSSSASDVARAATSGGYIVAWERSPDVYGQRYDSSGNTVGSEFTINTASGRSAGTPAVAMDADGNFVVVWVSLDTTLFTSDLRYRRYNSSGTALDASDVTVSGADTPALPDVAMDSDGNFAIVWDNGDNILFARYSSTGTVQTAATTVNTTNNDAESNPAIAMNSSGQFVIVWQSLFFSPSFGFDVYARVYNTAGSPLDTDFQVNGTPAPASPDADVGIDGSGTVVVVWAGSGTGDPDGVFARRYTSTGTLIGGEFRVNTTTTGTQQNPAVARDNDGPFTVTWEGNGTGDPDGVFAQLYTSAGAPDGGETQINTTITSGIQSGGGR